jgi:hypothetical protein
MEKFKVTIIRIEYSSIELEIDAINLDDANNIAIDIAPDMDYYVYDVEYKVSDF